MKIDKYYTTIIFDLDGTLIESSVGILEGFTLALQECNVSPKLAIDQSLIGPPLKQTIAKLIESDDDDLVTRVADVFKENYDSVGYLKTVLFEGVFEMLSAMSREYTLYIATNKRINPTLKIMKHLGIDVFFEAIYALDSFNPPLSSKGQLIGEIVSHHALEPKRVCYIGDRIEDGIAADDNTIDFIMASWGFDADRESARFKKEWTVLDKPSGIGTALAMFETHL